MKNKNILFFLGALLIVVLLIIIFNLRSDQNPTIGGQTGKHGCLIPAGYSWNETDQLCVREWTRQTCPEERGEVCITIYEPVCGLPTKKQYSNSCFACLDNEVKQYIDGQCQ